MAVEGHHDVTVLVQSDHTAISALRDELLHDDGVRRRGEGLAPVPHPSADVVRDDVAHEVLPFARSRHGAGRAGVGAGPDDRRIADPAPPLVGQAAGRGPGGDPPLLVQGHGADRAVLLGLRPLALQLVPATLGEEIRLGYERHSLLAG